MKPLFKLSILALLALSLDSVPDQVFAQNTDKPATEKKTAVGTNDASSSEKQPKAGPFHGKLVAVDKIAKTITVGKRTFLVTSETKLKKAGKPATLDEGVVGDQVSGYVKPREDGKLVATTVNFGPKSTSGESSEKKKDGASKDSK
jgi:hypothetical protein